MPAHIVYPLPPGMSFEQAALVEPVSIAVHARNLTPLAAGDTAVVVGRRPHRPDDAAGAAARRGRGRSWWWTWTTSAWPSRASWARPTSSTRAPRDVPAAVRALTGGRGADVAFEAVGIEATVRAAVGAVRKGGTVTLIGNLARDVSLPLQSVVTRQIRLQGSCASSGEYPECLVLIASGKVDVDRFISATAPLEEGARWFERLHRREPGLMKVLLRPNG